MEELWEKFVVVYFEFVNSSLVAIYLWLSFVIGQTIYIFILFLLSSSFFISSANLSGWRLDVCHTSTHGVALVRI